jgi:PTH1 family peptidyl-tRNA hydrolase
MYLIVGLGNPEDKYRFTRHNIGFMALDAFAEKRAFPDFALDKKSSALVSEGFIEHQKIVLAKPQTSMNNSGKAAAALCQKYRIRDLVVGASGKTEIRGRHFQDPEGLLSTLKPSALRYKASEFKYMIVVHDDIDLSLGRMKISAGSGSAGHKGVESIINALGTQDFGRIRLGIQPADEAGRPEGKPEHVEEFVLQRFSQGEQQFVEQTIQNALSALDSLLRDGLEKTMNEYN